MKKISLLLFIGVSLSLPMNALDGEQLSLLQLPQPEVIVKKGVRLLLTAVGSWVIALTGTECINLAASKTHRGSHWINKQGFRRDIENGNEEIVNENERATEASKERIVTLQKQVQDSQDLLNLSWHEVPAEKSLGSEEVKMVVNQANEFLPVLIPASLFSGALIYAMWRT